MAPPNAITAEARYFLEPQHSRHRQYEALRAYFVEGQPSGVAARQFGYTPGSFRVLCHKFRQGALGAFFRDLPRGPQVQAKKDPARPLIVALRKQNLSIYDIQDALAQQGHALSATAIHEVLRAEGFARLPRRRDDLALGLDIDFVRQALSPQPIDGQVRPHLSVGLCVPGRRHHEQQRCRDN